MQKKKNLLYLDKVLFHSLKLDCLPLQNVNEVLGVVNGLNILIANSGKVTNKQPVANLQNIGIAGTSDFILRI